MDWKTVSDTRGELEITLNPGTRLGPYEIVALLGAGGMGEVYRARDAKLQRDVAIKVLPASLAGDPQALVRFEREALAIASLSHPNILAIHDFGTDDGVAYAVIELLEGETLRARLAAGPIPQKQAVDYALQIAKGLSAAHEKGVVHRDLKPENILVGEDGHVKILDFGLAKRTEAVAPGKETSAPTDSAFTSPGTVMGTVGYMSPEQVRGVAVDHRSDLFSFGTVLYEMLSGARPFQRDTVGDTMAAILKEEPSELSSFGRSVSPALDHVVRHILEKDPRNRFQSAKDIGFALSEASRRAIFGGSDQRQGLRTGRLVAITATLAVIALAGAILWRRSHGAEPRPAAVKRVVVLPFENLGAPEDDYFTDGIADAVRGKLTGVHGLEVIARSSSISYKKTTKSQQSISDELRARYLLTATVRWQKTGSTSRVQVTPELVEIQEAGPPTSMWQQPFDATLTDVFQVQSDIASRVVQEIGIALQSGERTRLSERPTRNLAAYDAFLKGEAIRGFIDSGFSERRALGFYEQAVALDPTFADAWAEVAYLSSDRYSVNPEVDLARRAREAVERTKALAPESSIAYLALGNYELDVSNDPSAALVSYEQGLRLEPGNSELQVGRAVVEANLGRWRVAEGHFRDAERLDPRSTLPIAMLAQALGVMRRYRESRDVLDRGLGFAPKHLYLLELKAMTYLAEGDLSSARKIVGEPLKDVEPTGLVAQVASYSDLVWVLDAEQREILVRLTPSAFDEDRGNWAFCLLQAYALKRDSKNVAIYAEEARKAFEQALRIEPKDPSARRAMLAVALAYLGRKRDAIREGERAVALTPMKQNGFVAGPYSEHQLVRIYILTGEPEKALDHLEALLKLPYWLSPGWLKIDPNFDPIRNHPRFQKLVSRAP